MRALHLRKKRNSQEEEEAVPSSEKKRPDSAGSKTSQQEAEEMLKSLPEQRKLMQKLSAERSQARRNKWIEFQAKNMNLDIDHEKKIRFNYFRDVHQTNPTMLDFRPNSMLVKEKHLRQSVNQGNAQYAICSLEGTKPLLGKFKGSQQTIGRSRKAQIEKHLPLRLGDNNEHERMVRNIKSSVGGTTGSFDMVQTVFPQWRQNDKSQWMNNTTKNQFYLKDYTKPCWSQRGTGLTDGAKEPHILDDKSQLPTKPVEEKKSAISPQKREKRLHATRNQSNKHFSYPKNFKEFQAKLNPTSQRFNTATRNNIVWGNTLLESTSLRQKTHLLDQKEIKYVGPSSQSQENSPRNKAESNKSFGITIEEFSTMQGDRDKDDGMSKVANFLGASGLQSVGEEQPEKRAATTNATKRPRPNQMANQVKLCGSQPNLDESIPTMTVSQCDISQGFNNSGLTSNAVSMYLGEKNRPNTQGNAGARTKVASIKSVAKNQRPKPVKKPQRDISKNHVKVCDVTTENAFQIIDEFYDLRGKSFIENRLLLVEKDFQNSTDIGSIISPRTANVSKLGKSPNGKHTEAVDYLGFSQGHRKSVGLSQLDASFIQSRIDRKKAYYNSLYENGCGASGTQDDRKEKSHIITKFPYKDIKNKSKFLKSKEFDMSTTQESKMSRNNFTRTMFDAKKESFGMASSSIHDMDGGSPICMREKYHDLLQSQLGQTSQQAEGNWQEAQKLEKKQITELIGSIFNKNQRSQSRQNSNRPGFMSQRGNSRQGTQLSTSSRRLSTRRHTTFANQR